jgi:hypothetical protein
MGVVNKQQLVNENNRADIWNVKRSMNSIKETVQRIQGTKGYANFVEGIALKEETEQQEISEEAVDTFVQKFTKSTFEESLRDIFPLLHKVNEEEMENRRLNQVDRVKELISARTKKTDEIINVISFGAPKGDYDYEQIKKQYAEPRTPEEVAQRKIDMIAMTFDDLADRIEVDTLDDKKGKKKGHDRAAELSFFLTDIANDIRKNPAGVDKEELKVAGHLLKMSKVKIEKQTKTADEKWDMMVESAFSKFDPSKIEMREDDSELNIAKKQPTFDDLVQMSNEADYEMGDIVVFGMKNHPAYRFDIQGDLDGETVRVASTHGGTDHSGFLNIKVDDIKANINGAAIIAIEDDNKSPFQDGNNIKSMVGWSSADEVYPPEMADKPSGKGPDGEIASGPDDDQVRMRHLAGVDDF